MLWYESRELTTVKMKIIPKPPSASDTAVLTLISPGVTAKLGIKGGSAGKPITNILIKSPEVSVFSRVTANVPTPRVITVAKIPVSPGVFSNVVEAPGVKRMIPGLYIAGFARKLSSE